MDLDIECPAAGYRVDEILDIGPPVADKPLDMGPAPARAAKIASIEPATIIKIPKTVIALLDMFGLLRAGQGDG